MKDESQKQYIIPGALREAIMSYFRANVAYGACENVMEALKQLREVPEAIPAPSPKAVAEK